ncbi:MAG: hypothetical protein MHM6MM_006474 [Cercozoa sp. M6MM]
MEAANSMYTPGMSVPSFLPCAGAPTDIETDPQVPRMHLGKQAELLLLSVLHTLAAKRANLRLEALHALRFLVVSGGGQALRASTGFREHNILPLRGFFAGDDTVRHNLFARLVRDPNWRVRRLFFTVLCDWLLNWERVWEYQTFIVPYFLSAIFDADEEVRSWGFEAMELVGARFARDHPNLVSRRAYFGKQVAMERGENDWERVWTERLPKPHVRRPALGSRCLVTRQFGHWREAVLKELCDWRNDFQTSRSALLLLMHSIVYLERAAVQSVPEILSALVKVLVEQQGATGDIVRQVIRQICGLLGRLCAGVAKDDASQTLSNPTGHAEQSSVAWRGHLKFLRGQCLGDGRYAQSFRDALSELELWMEEAR